MLRGDRVKALRSSLDLSQTELADAAGLDQRRISKYENSESGATDDAIAGLARALGTSTDYLLGLTDDPSPIIEMRGLDDIERAAIAARRRGDFAEAARLILSH